MLIMGQGVVLVAITLPLLFMKLSCPTDEVRKHEGPGPGGTPFPE
jgi:hypothetical protein